VAAAPVAPAVTVAEESAAGAAVAGAALVVAAAAVVSVAAGLSLPPHAPRMVALARSAIPWNRISVGLQ
jgi:hypothetical protein